MSADAIIMMVLAITVLWGGLVLAMWNLSANDPFKSDSDRT